MTKKKEEQVKKVESEKKYARLPEKLVAGLPAADLLNGNERIKIGRASCRERV